MKLDSDISARSTRCGSADPCARWSDDERPDAAPGADPDARAEGRLGAGAVMLAVAVAVFSIAIIAALAP